MEEEISLATTGYDEEFAMSEEEWNDDLGQQIFGNALVLNEIFKNLPTPDLLKCSLVNKLWNYEARCVLREWKICTARTTSWTPCADLREFNNLLRNIRNSPFNGLALNIEDDYHESDACIICHDVTELYNAILAQLPLKYLKINWQFYDYDGPIEATCPAVILLKTILESKLHEVEELHLVDFLEFSGTGAYPREKILSKEIRLPKLKLLKVYPNADLPPFLIEDLISVAPNLQDFQIECSNATAIRNLSPSKYKIIKKLIFRAFEISEEAFCHAFALSQPALYHLDILRPSGDTHNAPERPAANFEKWIETLQLIFSSSSRSLESLHCDFIILLILMSSPGVPVLENVVELKIGIDFRLDVLVRDRLRRFNFTRTFPRVSRISVVVSSPMQDFWPQHVLDFVTFQDDNNVVEEAHSLASSITVLDVDAASVGTVEENPHFTRYAIEFCGELFPNLRELNLTAVCYRPLPYHQIWASMSNLEDIKITEYATDCRSSNDSPFCGINWKEERWLQRKDDKFLRNYHLVPIRPSLTSLPNLKRLHLVLNPRSNLTVKRRKRYLSKVTGFLAFSRLPNLEVTIESAREFEGVHQIQPFVTNYSVGHSV